MSSSAGSYCPTRMGIVILLAPSCPGLFPSSFQSTLLLDRSDYLLPGLSHQSDSLRLNTSTVWAVLRPFSFSSRLMRVAAAASPMETAKMGSRRLRSLEFSRAFARDWERLPGDDVLVRHGRGGWCWTLVLGRAGSWQCAEAAGSPKRGT